MAQYYELEEYGEIPGYFGEVFNPFGYVGFVTDPNRDYLEKAEHAAVAASVFGGAFYGVHMISGGGASMSMWHGSAGGRPGFFYRVVSIGKWKGDMMMKAGRHAYHGGRHAARWLPFAAAAALAVDMVANPLDSIFMRGATALFEAIDPWGISSFEMR